MAKDKKKKQNSIYFNIRITDEIGEDAESKVNRYLTEQGTGIYTFYNTYVYVPFMNKIKEKDFKKVETALKNRDYASLDLHPVIYEDPSSKAQLYACFPKINNDQGKYSWVYMKMVDYIEFVESLEKQYHITLVLSNTNIIVPQILWSELKLIHNIPIIDFGQKEDLGIVFDGQYRLLQIEDHINMNFFQAIMAYKNEPSEEKYNAIIQLLDEADVTVYMPIDIPLSEDNIEQFKLNLEALNYTNILSRTIFDSKMGKACLVYTSKRYIPEELLHRYTWVSVNFVEAFRILRENPNWDYLFINYLNYGFKANRNGLDALYEDTFALGNPANLAEVNIFPMMGVLEQFEEITEAYLYEAYNRIGYAILYNGGVDPVLVREKLAEVYPRGDIFACKLEDYEIHVVAQPFYVK